MDGFIVVHTDHKLNFDFNSESECDDYYIIKKDKKIYYQNSLYDLETMSMVFESFNSGAVNYLTKNVKVCSWVTGDITNCDEIKNKYNLDNFLLAEAFIEATSNKLTLKANAKNFYEQLDGSYNAIIANLTYNTRSSVIFLSRDKTPIKLCVVIKDNTVILCWDTYYSGNEVIQFKRMGYEIYSVTNVNNCFTLQPLYLINKFKERKNKYSMSVALSYLYKYLAS